ncbi:MAG: segregation and condensation protein segregation and condensation protein [Candidatus Parcubacteria bacterium]|jgi:segregation and condensation protein A
MSTDFSVSTKVFEGPLSLLLDLIEKRKLLINEISLSQVTNDFLEFVSILEQKDLYKITDFLSIASTLILIKSKSLLPQLDLNPEETTEIEDLELRLKLLQIIRRASKDVKDLFGKKPQFSRLHIKKQIITFSPTQQIDVLKMKWFIDQVLHHLPKTEKKPEKRVTKTISLEEMMNKVINRVRQNMTISFKTLSKEHKEKKNVIISFLAILELVKLGNVDANQHSTFEDILVETKEPSIPSYGA